VRHNRHFLVLMIIQKVIDMMLRSVRKEDKVVFDKETNMTTSDPPQIILKTSRSAESHTIARITGLT
jgi:hypothetical protein